ncbi:MAG: cold-shock protein [Boseongicola sp. SB0670_bin_30]|nr:cold-shock protein [Boseongicola sp. SB0670_bin_30]
MARLHSCRRVAHISAVERSGLATLNEGLTVTFDLVPGRNGRMAAKNIKLAG